MDRYENLNGDSGVAAYQIGPGEILVQFKSGDTYRYTHASAGRRTVEHMKRLALRGEGLATYISQHVRNHYATKLASR